jgi:hypothetical protein
VAWSTFITGLDPPGHGIFDFVHRDPKTMQPYSSMSRTVEPRFRIPLGPYVLPLSSARVETLRRGQAFWKILADGHIPVAVIHMPTNFPPVKVGEALAGMGTPDMRGTQGTFTYFTDDPEELARDLPGGRIVKVHGDNGRFILPVEGPPNSLRKDLRFASVDLVVHVDPEHNHPRLSVGETVAIMNEGVVGLAVCGFSVARMVCRFKRNVSGLRQRASSAPETVRFATQYRSALAGPSYFDPVLLQ